MLAVRAAVPILLSAVLTALAASPLPYRVDSAITVWLQHAAPQMDVPASLLVLLGNAEVAIPAVALAGVLLLVRNRAWALGILALAVGLAVMSLVAVLLKHVIVHPGPPPELQRHVLRSALSLHRTPYSYPSGHTIRTTMLAGLLLPRHWSAGVLVVSMMAALVYLGDHWTTDVLGGLGVGWVGVEIARGIRERVR